MAGFLLLSTTTVHAQKDQNQSWKLPQIKEVNYNTYGKK